MTAIIDLIKSKARRQAERRADFLEFLCSRDGRQCLQELLIDMRLHAQLDPVLENAQSRMLEFIASTIAGMKAHVERSLKDAAAAHCEALSREQAVISRHAQVVSANLQAQLCTHTQSIVEITRETTGRVIYEVLQNYLISVLREEVRSFIQAGPIFSNRRSNREVAALNGISIREVKRRRRRGEFD